MDLNVRNNESKSRYETEVDGHLGFCNYTLAPGRITFTHTEVAPELSGRGVAQALVRGALDDARARKLAVVPQCSYVAAFIQRNPDYQDLLEKE